MKNLLLFILFINLNYAQQKSPTSNVYDVSCGQCKFGIKKPGCDLAIKINNQAYFVTGTNIDAHGDAHSKHGFCTTIRQAEVHGTLKNNIFEVTYFKLLPVVTTEINIDNKKN